MLAPLGIPSLLFFYIYIKIKVDTQKWPSNNILFTWK